ncbi:hemerythrin domain-containing protein [Mycolicibacterium fallax]|uniref:Hemerythrin-like domain-containing protein n=1 Tax=Mycolicibacterium fallax TaxID=1793 RepID=A0A1X1R7Z1_MYCFA|nr:hemerythrin domain-containing protein [Mycolicibacterium fallax]ORV00953.1 hypothetical protein AWC04_14870 [Mycolicibacterium fallax]BBZ00504.1 hemerythrin [Mycolicibacterium fallax]HOW93601.1 hemerythrin domain-containing protein [Mycolicibacterium fallax]
MSAPDATDPAVAYTAEHRAIDAEIERFLDAPDDGAALRTALDTLRRHIYLEEKFMFPPLRAAGLMMPIMVMIREHGELWRAMDAIEAGDPDPAACRELLRMLAVHNDKEEPIVYPQATELDCAADLTELLTEAAMPDGWVCAAA